MGKALAPGSQVGEGEGSWPCWGFSADPSLPRTEGSCGQGTHVPALPLQREGHSAPLLGLSSRMHALERVQKG